jgi:PadR family transcriptional regulator, regulatory protein AphA
MIRLTPVSYIVLGMLDRVEEATPYLLKQMAAAIGDLWSVQHAQVYSEPRRLAEAGLVAERREEGGRRRRLYRLTDAGREALAAWLATPTAELTELRDPGLLQLCLGADPAALAEVQHDAHARKLAEYEATLAAGGEDAPRGARLTLLAGIGHEREWVRFWAGLRDGGPSGDTT